MSMRNANVAKTWGTWYTQEGERADAWPVETLANLKRRNTTREVFLAGSRDAMAGGGAGLGGILQRRLPRSGDGVGKLL
jgi:hypothetical protein